MFIWHLRIKWNYRIIISFIFSYKSDRYAKWREKSKLNQMQEANDQEDNNGDFKNKSNKRQYNGLPSGHPAMKKVKMAGTGHKKGPKSGIPKLCLNYSKAGSYFENMRADFFLRYQKLPSQSTPEFMHLQACKKNP